MSLWNLCWIASLHLSPGAKVAHRASICVGYQLGNDLPQFPVHPPSQAVPEECVKVQDVATLLRRDRPYIVQLLEVNFFTNAARSRITTNPKQEVRDYVYTFMYPEE